MRHAFTTAALVLTAAMTGGCASFNDTIVVDVGDQFRLLETGVSRSDANGRPFEAAQGFECTFRGTTNNAGPFATEREFSGTLRCVRIGVSVDGTSGVAGQ